MGQEAREHRAPQVDLHARFIGVGRVRRGKTIANTGKTLRPTCPTADLPYRSYLIPLSPYLLYKSYIL